MEFTTSRGVYVLVVGGFSLIGLTGAVVSFVAPSDTWVARVVAFVLFVGSCAVAIYTLALRPRLTVTAEEVRVVGPVSSRVVPLKEVRAFEPGLRLTIVMKSGERIPVWVVQNTRYTTERGGRGPAHWAAERLEAFRRTHVGDLA